ncbi:MAG: hypothetical protein K2L70_05715 [Clostridia bacterium]|nr:hypothetical protein [Clostridia bacterium]
MRELENVRDNVLRIFDNDSWIQFVHEGLLPAYTSQEKQINIQESALSRHCAICRNINGCCFPKNNMPRYPLHPNIERNLGKKALFESWGYDTMNIQYLIYEITKQAKEGYESGNFILDKLDGYGQRISIVTELERKDKKEIVKFLTGCMVYPNGNIQLTTPYGGKVK